MQQDAAAAMNYAPPQWVQRGRNNGSCCRWRRRRHDDSWKNITRLRHRSYRHWWLYWRRTILCQGFGLRVLGWALHIFAVYQQRDLQPQANEDGRQDNPANNLRQLLARLARQLWRRFITRAFLQG